MLPSKFSGPCGIRTHYLQICSRDMKPLERDPLQDHLQIRVHAVETFDGSTLENKKSNFFLFLDLRIPIPTAFWPSLWRINDIKLPVITSYLVFYINFSNALPLIVPRYLKLAGGFPLLFWVSSGLEVLACVCVCYMSDIWRKRNLCGDKL